MFKGSDLLIAALENEGVERIFGIPGEENLDIVESIRKSSIQLILTRHEQAAAFMAATYGRLTGKPGVCITTLGPGALNLSTGAAYALLGAMPMIMLTGQKGILSSRQARFQVVDMVAAMKPLTKLSRQIVSPLMIPTLVREAFRVAGEERYCGGEMRGSRPRSSPPGRASAGEPGRPRQGRADHHASQIPPVDVRGGGIQAAVDFGSRPIRVANTNTLLHDADG
jgi:hypothetical protein